MQAKGNQNIFDFVLQAFGTLENLFDDVLVPNSLNVDGEVQTNQEININTIGKGDDDVKMKISEQGLSMTNGDIPIIVEYRNGIVTNSFFGQIAIFDFEARANFSGLVNFTINWGTEVGTTTLSSTLSNGVWKALQTSIAIPLGVDPNQIILVTDNFGGSFEVGYIVKSLKIGEWLFKGNAFDTSGNGNDGTVNGAILTTDRDSNPDSAYNFIASSSQNIALGDLNSIFIDKTIIILDVWFYRPASGTIQNVAFFNASGDRCLFAWWSDNIIYNLVENGAANTYISTAANTATGWHLLRFTFNGNEPLQADRLKIYYDLSLQTVGITGTIPATLSNNFARLSVIGSDGGAFFTDGKIDDVILYNKVLP